VQPHRSGAGAAVVDEGDGALRGVFGIGANVGSGIDQRLRLVFFVFQQDGTGDGFVGNRLAGDFDGVLGDRGLFFGSRRGGLSGLFFLDSLGFFFLGAFLCAGWQDREEKRERTR